MIQFGPIVMGCRKCLAAPGYPCVWASGPRDLAVDFHAIRERDAKAASALLDDNAPSDPTVSTTPTEYRKREPWDPRPPFRPRSRKKR